MQSTLVVPLLHKSQSIGALNVLSRDRDRYSERDVAILRQFAAHVATALVNARLFAQQRNDAEAFETLAEIGREMARSCSTSTSCCRASRSWPRGVVDYRTFGILLLNEATDELEIKIAVQVRREGRPADGAAWAKGWSATPRSTAKPCSRRTCRRIRGTSRSSRTCGRSSSCRCCIKDRCIGVFDLESPELDAFSKRDVEILTLLASQAAVSIENARLVRAAVGQRSPARTRAPVRAARAGRAAADPAAEEGAGRRPGRVVRARARTGRRLPRLPGARLEHADHRGRRRVGEGCAGGAVRGLRR